jgi:hypothetical protein
MAIPVLTGALSGKWEPIDSVLGIGSSKVGWASGANIDDAFAECKQILRLRAESLGGDAVINVDYEIRNFDKGIEVIAFGTVIKIVEEI